MKAISQVLTRHNYILRNFIVLLIMILPITSLYSQSGDFCKTEFENMSGVCPKEIATSFYPGPYFFRLYIHVVRKDDGTGGQTKDDVKKALDYLYKAFEPHNIYFSWDNCEIDYIDNTEFYNKLDASILFYENNGDHEDGFDIYLLPDHPSPNAIGAGRAKKLFSTSLFVGGNYSKSPYTSYVKSHVLSHEVGHCLGLLHTHHNEKPLTLVEYVEHRGDTCLIAGDCICDTPADPEISLEVSYPECEWLGNEKDPNGDTYDPSTINIMSYTHIECYKEFTPDQGQRARYWIEHKSVLQDALIDSMVIDNNTIWNLNNTSGLVDVDGNLIVKSGNQLVIESNVTVEFNRGTKLIIEPNATVILIGKLTNEPCTKTWKGVEVWGNSDMHQFEVSGYKAQGRLVCRNGAVIENAKVGVQLWGPTKDSSGGVISCTGTTFRNNLISIDFFKYENYYPENYPLFDLAGKPHDYFASFRDCDFVINDNFPHNEPFSKFVNLIGVKGPSFRGCSFINTGNIVNAQNIADFGFGIYAINSRFTISGECTTFTFPCTQYNRSSFSGLGYGIYTVDMGRIKSGLKLSRTDFQNCFVGVEASSIASMIAFKNKFTLGTVPSTTINADQVGLMLADRLGALTVEENEFIHTTSTTDVRTIGIWAASLGYSNKEIRKNTFTGLDIGNMATGTNSSADGRSGLVYRCNVNINNSQYDFLICDNQFTADRIRQSQNGNDSEGEIIATGNQFSNTGTPLDRDFANQEFDAENTFKLRYYYKKDAGPVEKPDEYIGVKKLIKSQQNNCLTNYCNPPCLSTAELHQVKLDFYVARGNFTASYNLYETALLNNHDSLAQNLFDSVVILREIMDESAYTIITHQVYDTLKRNSDSLRRWFSMMNYYGSEVRIAFDYLLNENYQAGQIVLNNISSKIQLTTAQINDLSDVQSIFNILSSTSPYTLTSNEINQLKLIAEQPSEGIGKGIAQNILSYYGMYYKKTDCTISTGNRMQKEDEVLEETSIEIYPNPSFDYFIVTKDKIDRKCSLSLYDITGRKILSEILLKKEDITRINAVNLSPGMYFYRISSGGSIIKTGKIVLQ